jgi:NitT/TauT family transport system permease protein
MRKLASRVLWAVALPALLLVGWEAAAVVLGNRAIVPRVGAVVSRLLHPLDNLLQTGSLAWHTGISAFRVVCGFLLAALVAIPLGLVMGVFARPRRLIGPVVELLRPLCPIAWIPFALVVFRTYSVSNVLGYRYSRSILDHVQLGMLFIIFYGGFFPILLNTIAGVMGVRRIYVESALTLGARGGQIFRKVLLPASLPSILTGLRVGLGIAWMVIIAAEMLPGSDSGIGYLIMYAYELAEMDILVAGMIVIGVVGAALSKLIAMAASRLTGWQAKER